MTGAVLNIVQKIDTFVSAKGAVGNNSWFNRDGIEVYIRLGYHVLQSTPYQCLDLANVIVEKKSQGHFTQFLDQLENVAAKHGKPLYVENVLNDRLVEFFVKRGYDLAVARGLCNTPSFYKHLGEQHVPTR